MQFLVRHCKLLAFLYTGMMNHEGQSQESLPCPSTPTFVLNFFLVNNHLRPFVLSSHLATSVDIFRSLSPSEMAVLATVGHGHQGSIVPASFLSLQAVPFCSHSQGGSKSHLPRQNGNTQVSFEIKVTSAERLPYCLFLFCAGLGS